MKEILSRFVEDESGATAIEYGIIAAGVSVVVITVVQLAGERLEIVWQEIADGLIPPG